VLDVVGRVLEEDFGPHQIRTFRVPADPAAPVQEVDLVEWPVAVDSAAGEDEDLPVGPGNGRHTPGHTSGVR
jgi:hypothetical protein